MAARGLGGLDRCEVLTRPAPCLVEGLDGHALLLDELAHNVGVLVGEGPDDRGG